MHDLEQVPEEREHDDEDRDERGTRARPSLYAMGTIATQPSRPITVAVWYPDRRNASYTSNAHTPTITMTRNVAAGRPAANATSAIAAMITPVMTRIGRSAVRARLDLWVTLVVPAVVALVVPGVVRRRRALEPTRTGCDLGRRCVLTTATAAAAPTARRWRVHVVLRVVVVGERADRRAVVLAQLAAGEVLVGPIGLADAEARARAAGTTRRSLRPGRCRHRRARSAPHRWGDRSSAGARSRQARRARPSRRPGPTALRRSRPTTPRPRPTSSRRRPGRRTGPPAPASG